MNDHILSLHKQLNKMDRLGEMISIMDVLDNKKTLVTRENSLVQVLRLEGKDYGGLSDEEVSNLYRKRQGFFEGLSSRLQISIHYHRVRYNIEDRAYNMSNEYAGLINSKHGARFTAAFRTDVYIVVSKKDTRPLSKTGLPKRSLQAEFDYYEIEARKLSDEVETIKALLEDYGPRDLYHTLDGDSDLLSFWMYLLNAGSNEHLTPVQSNDLNNAMALSDIQIVSQKKDNLFRKLEKIFKQQDVENETADEINKAIRETYDRFDADYIITHTPSGKRYTAFVAMKSYPDETEHSLFDGIMAVQANFVMVQHIRLVEDEKARASIETKLNRWQTVGKFSGAVQEDLYECNSELQAGAFRIARHALSVAIHGATKEECERNVRLIQQAFNSAYINPLRERFATEHVFWSQFPDYEVMNEPRGGMVTTENLANLVNFASHNHGNDKCSFGDAPVSYFKTPDGQNYAFTFHPSPQKYVAGHTMVFGSTGSGKTVLMNFLMSECLKYQGEGKERPLRQIIFDSLRGDYIDFTKGGVQMNPFHMPDTEENRGFLLKWLANLAGGMTAAEEEKAIRAISRAYELEPSERSLHHLRLLFGVESFNDPSGGPSLAARLAKWMPDPENPSQSKYSTGLYFNHANDALSFDKRIVGFEMAQVLKDQELLPTLTSYIFHRFLQSVSEAPTPHVCFMDEAIGYINNDTMYPFIEKFLREQRKINGVFVGAVQSPSLIMGNDRAEELLSHIKTYIIFPDTSAVPEDYIGNDAKRGLGLTRSEFDWVRSKKTGREVMIKRSTGESVILNVDLSSLGKHLVLLRSEAELVDRFETIHKDYKEQAAIAVEQGTPLPRPWQEQLMEESK